MSKGEGIMPWNSPAPPRMTTEWPPGIAYENPARGSKFFNGLLIAALGQVSPCQRNP
jgi:hypothetical protein